MGNALPFPILLFNGKREARLSYCATQGFQGKSLRTYACHAFRSRFASLKQAIELIKSHTSGYTLY